MTRRGGDLALLLLAAFRTLADRATVELANRGYEDFRPVHDFALHSILGGADNASELGRAMAVTKQAAARTIGILEERDWVVREVDPNDRRKLRLRVTEQGMTLLREGEAIFNELRDEWERQVGRDSIESLEHSLRSLVGENVIRLNSPGWSAQGITEQPA
ncbi:transcriptional regulator, MarR family [Kribbella flavida DSM 17836]|uniref:Transcriptional regulator, MarR family n=1 Tax=Kribbella flavida (strain DSM 17836 / JCM 10339 / NBRC 14399) TaxID=479435 RepID=D2PT35_KRIFD|nr:MarR family transcriptional regulator [Kribbella flavida]ADB29351.1 transcriptional regulator, MarR family [Kribbella flavida DSM 17836]